LLLIKKEKDGKEGEKDVFGEIPVSVEYVLSNFESLIKINPQNSERNLLRANK